MNDPQKGPVFTEIVLEVFKLGGLLVSEGDDMGSEYGITSARWKILGALFLAGEPHVAACIRQHRRGVKQTAAGVTVAAGDHLRTLGQGVADELLHLGQRRFINHRSLFVTILVAGRYVESGHPFGKTFREPVMDAGLDIEPVGADAGLAGIAAFCDQRAFHRTIKIGIIKNDERRKLSSCSKPCPQGPLKPFKTATHA